MGWRRLNVWALRTGTCELLVQKQYLACISDAVQKIPTAVRDKTYLFDKGLLITECEKKELMTNQFQAKPEIESGCQAHRLLCLHKGMDTGQGGEDF